MCIFCDKMDGLIYVDDYVKAFYDNYPVNKGHVLIVPHRHAETFFDLTTAEKTAVNVALDALKKMSDETYKPDGYNIGVNVGGAAGQTVFHVHIHLIPRYKDDMKDPRGGVRGVIPEKQKYKKNTV